MQAIVSGHKLIKLEEEKNKNKKGAQKILTVEIKSTGMDQRGNEKAKL